MDQNSFYRIYFSRDIENLELSQDIHQELKVALAKHWSGELNEALDTIEKFKARLTPRSDFYEFVITESLLINAKLGRTEAFKTFNIGEVKSLECKYIIEYAAFSMAFWIDHKVAWRALWKMLLISTRIQEVDSTSMVIFLMCHLLAISGKKIWFFEKAQGIYKRAIQHIISQNGRPNFFQNIIVAAFPYTVFVSNKISEDLTEILVNGEKYLPFDPYYRSLFNVSGLYCYAYSGDVTRTELYVTRLQEAQARGNLLRYRPVSAIMKFLPFALRGYAFLILEDFKILMKDSDNENGHPLISSQFFRAAGIIYLALGEYHQAKRSILKAIAEREKTKSFSAWKLFDEKLLDLAENQKQFNPQFDPILTHKLQYENNAQFMKFLLDTLSLASASVSLDENEFYGQVKGKFENHLGHPNIQIRKSLDDETIKNPLIKMGDRYFVLIDVPKERDQFVRSLLNSMGPISIIVMNSFYVQKRAYEFEKVKSLAAIASQVSHDIRSPLSALSMVLPSIENIPEEKRLLLRNATQRINDIANQLLTKSKQESGSQTDNQLPKLSVELLPSILDVIISEKRTQFRNKLGIEVELDLKDSYGAFVSIDVLELKRVISNLINNVVEAFQDNRGKIRVTIRTHESAIELIISDNGKGIPAHILSKLGEQGVTHGKSGTDSGSGLGIYHAKKTIEVFGGNFQIESQVGIGTNVIMKFNRAVTPPWFVQNLNFCKNQVIVCLDDDVSIHQVWKGRFGAVEIQNAEVQTFHFSSGKDLKKWVTTSPLLAKEALFLVDYELIGQAETGLDLIDSLGISKQSILVTSRFEEALIRKRCDDLQVKMIPKPMANLIPIEVSATKVHYDACVIDDDPLVKMTWEFAAKEKNAKVIVFANEMEFIAASNVIEQNSPVFVDVNLANGVNGVDVVNRLHERGFNKLYLGTGYSSDMVEDIPNCVICVRGKDPLFDI